MKLHKDIRNSSLDNRMNESSIDFPTEKSVQLPILERVYVAST